MYNLREFVSAHVILAPGACGRVGRNSGRRHPKRFCAGRAGRGGRVPKRAKLRRDLFLVFFMDLSSKTPTFESFFGASPARNALKSRCFGREVHGKVDKTSHDSSGGAGRLWRSGSALGGSGGAPGGLGELWEVYI